MRIYWLNDSLCKGSIGMTARPRGNDWLEGEIKRLKNIKVDIVISLLEQHEIIELEIEKEAAFCKENNIKFINYPIKDRSVPDDKSSFLKLIEFMFENLETQKKIIVHCRMGIGRTGIVVAAFLIKNGMNKNEVFEILSKARTLKMPDTEEQSQWVKDLAIELKSN